MMTKKLLALLMALLLAAAPALAQDTTGDASVTVSGNGASVQVPVYTHPAETAVMATGSLGAGLLSSVVAPNGTLTVDVASANPNAAILLLPLNMIADTKAYDTNAELYAWTLFAGSGLRFDKEFMKAIFGSAVRAAAQTALRSMANSLASLWDRSDDAAAHAAFAQAASTSPLALEIGMDTAISAARMAQGEAIGGKPIIGGVTMWIDVGGVPVASSTPVQVRTQFALPAGGSASGVTVVHEENGQTTAIPCTVSGSDVSFDTTKRGDFYVVYDKNAVVTPTEKPAETAKPTETAKPSVTAQPVPPSQLPATGDTSPIILWLALMAVCGCSALALIRWKKRV